MMPPSSASLFWVESKVFASGTADFIELFFLIPVFFGEDKWMI